MTAEQSLGVSEPSADEVGLFAFRVWGYKQGEVVSLLIHLGDRLGLFTVLRDLGPGQHEASAVAAGAGLHERWVREWLRGMAAAGLVDSSDGDLFSLSPAGAIVLANEGNVAFAAGAFAGGFTAGYVDRIAEAFRTGIGPDYDTRGVAGTHTTERMTAAWTRTALVPILIPRLDGMPERLSAGGRVLDIGCGAGVAVATVAEAFPNTQVVGVDLSAHAVARATANVAALPNATVMHGRAEDVTAAGDYDLVLTFDVLHDLTRPAAAADAARRALREDGTWLVKEVRCADSWEGLRANPMLAMFFGFSVSACLASATSEPGGAGLGTVGLPPPALEALVRAAGFTRFEVHDINDPANLYYEIRP